MRVYTARAHCGAHSQTRVSLKNSRYVGFDSRSISSRIPVCTYFYVKLGEVYHVGSIECIYGETSVAGVAIPRRDAKRPLGSGMSARLLNLTRPRNAINRGNKEHGVPLSRLNRIFAQGPLVHRSDGYTIRPPRDFFISIRVDLVRGGGETCENCGHENVSQWGVVKIQIIHQYSEHEHN